MTRASGKALGEIVLRSSLGRLDGSDLCAAARRRTGLEDFGSPGIEPALSTLVSSLEEEADLHPVGRLLLRFHLRDLLETRLRLEHTWAQQRPGLQSAPVSRPLFIIGMPRSGSTFLHELLAQDPRNRAPLVWEVMFPLAAVGGDERERRRHVRKAAACLWWFRRLAPAADSVYPMRACSPHECVAIHSYTLLSEEFVSTCRIPRYERFLRSANLGAVYEWQKRFLQYLQAGGSGRRWVLKSPDHVYGLEHLFSTFPDAVVLQTHRDPLEVLASSIELTQVLHGLYAWRGDRDRLAAREARVLAEGTERFIGFRDAQPALAGRFVDVKYADLIANPLGTVAGIYQRLDTPLTPQAASRMRQLAANRARYCGRRVRLSPGKLRRDAPAEARLFERYCARFGLTVWRTGFSR